MHFIFCSIALLIILFCLLSCLNGGGVYYVCGQPDGFVLGGCGVLYGLSVLVVGVAAVGGPVGYYCLELDAGQAQVDDEGVVLVGLEALQVYPVGDNLLHLAVALGQLWVGGAHEVVDGDVERLGAGPRYEHDAVGVVVGIEGLGHCGGALGVGVVPLPGLGWVVVDDLRCAYALLGNLGMQLGHACLAGVVDAQLHLGPLGTAVGCGVGGVAGVEPCAVTDVEPPEGVEVALRGGLVERAFRLLGVGPGIAHADRPDGDQRPVAVEGHGEERLLPVDALAGHGAVGVDVDHHLEARLPGVLGVVALVLGRAANLRQCVLEHEAHLLVDGLLRQVDVIVVAEHGHGAAGAVGLVVEVLSAEAPEQVDALGGVGHGAVVALAHDVVDPGVNALRPLCHADDASRGGGSGVVDGLERRDVGSAVGQLGQFAVDRCGGIGRSRLVDGVFIMGRLGGQQDVRGIRAVGEEAEQLDGGRRGGGGLGGSRGTVEDVGQALRVRPVLHGAVDPRGAGWCR